MNSIASASYAYSPSLVGFHSPGELPASLKTRQEKPVEALGSVDSGNSASGKRGNGAEGVTVVANPDEKATQDAQLKKKQVTDAAEQRQLLQDQKQIAQLAARDREVRAHEQAHMAVGGQYAGAASYQYQRGPDGVSYAVGGEVPIDVGREASPQATIDKMQIVKRAALAPAEPSSQDRKVAAQAAQIEAQARVELRQEPETEEVENDKSVSESGGASQIDQGDSIDQDSTTNSESRPSDVASRLLVSIANTDPSSISSRTSRFSQYA